LESLEKLHARQTSPQKLLGGNGGFIAKIYISEFTVGGTLAIRIDGDRIIVEKAKIETGAS
jgi:hypothetical protein